MPDWSRLEEIMKKMEPIRKAFGPVKQPAIPVFESCIDYNIEEVTALARLSQEIQTPPLTDETMEKIGQFKKLLADIRPVEVHEKILLWPDGNMPAETDYTDNSDFRYNHDPDFIPYLYEMLLPADVTPRGAVVLCAGGDHGEPCLKVYQVGLDFNAMGYQCFVLLNRTNHNPWTAREAGADAARAVRIVRSKAEEYRIRPDQIAFAGFSNGGLTGEGLIEHFSGKQTIKAAFPAYKPDALDELPATPDAFLCIYGPRFNGEPFDWTDVVYPPTFFAVGREDTAMDNLNYVYPDLIAHGVPTEIHTFAGVPHGLAGQKILDGKAPFPNFELWLTLADSFLADLFG